MLKNRHTQSVFRFLQGIILCIGMVFAAEINAATGAAPSPFSDPKMGETARYLQAAMDAGDADSRRTIVKLFSLTDVSPEYDFPSAERYKTLFPTPDVDPRYKAPAVAVFDDLRARMDTAIKISLVDIYSIKLRLWILQV